MMKRILLLGDKGVGKTTFFNIFLHKQVNTTYQQTLGIQAAAKTVQFEDHSYINFQIWDTPGELQYHQMAYPFYKNCKFFILILDRSNKQTLKTFRDWLEKINEHNPGKSSNLLLILNKTQAAEYFNRETFENQYSSLFKDPELRLFCINSFQIDLLEEKNSMEELFIKPFLYQYSKSIEGQVMRQFELFDTGMCTDVKLIWKQTFFIVEY